MHRAVILLLGILLAGCAAGQVNTPAPGALRIAGSTSLQPTLESLAAAYQARAPHILIDVRGGGTAAGVQQLRGGQVDIAASSWHAEDALDASDLRVVPVAQDGVAVIVHPSNPITNLTALQLRALYRGEVLDWAALGGSGGAPVIISREDGSGTRAAFEALAMGGAQVTLNALVMPTSRAVVDYVATHHLAVGYVSNGSVNDQVRVVPVEEVAPAQEALRSGAYRLRRTLVLYAAQPPPPEAQAFLDFVLSPAGQAIVGQHLIPVR